MSDRKYEPQPLDTSAVKLPVELEQLREYLARNTHEVWARQRMKEGWTYGESGDMEKKTHPDLIQYDELSEGEKEYDRNTSTETLKVILLLGYDIARKT